MADAYTDMAAKVRWCLFVDPVNVYRGSKVRLEAVLVNLDALKPGEYPVRVQVVGPGMTRPLDKTIIVEVPEASDGPEPPFARPVFDEALTVDGPEGRYRFLVTFERGAAAGGGDVSFYAGDAAQMPAVRAEIVVWGQDAELAALLSGLGIRTRSYREANQEAREVILASGAPPSPGRAEVFAELARRMARGSTVVFLTPTTLMEPKLEQGASVSSDDIHVGDGSGPALRWAPLPAAARPSLDDTPVWYFRADHWAKEHPIFEGLPCGGIVDYTFYRDILPAVVEGTSHTKVIAGLQPPLEAVSGAIQTTGGGIDYRSDLLISVHDLGAGRFILNGLQIRENLGKVPAAERLLRNMLNYAARDIGQPLVDLPDDFDTQLRAMGYI